MYYLGTISVASKGADQLSGYRASYMRGYRAADLHLRFRKKKQKKKKNRFAHDAAHIKSLIPELTN